MPQDRSGNPRNLERLFAQRRTVFCLGLWVLVACSEPLEIKWFELPQPSTSLDPDSVLLGTRVFNCHNWFGPAPAGPSVILDAIFDHNSDKGPTQAQLRAVAEAGGEIGYKFTFPALRIRIAPANVPELYQVTEAVFFSVPDLRRYDWLVTVIYSRDLTFADDSVFAALGGRVTDRLTSIDMLVGIMPDRSIPIMRRQSGVTHIEKSRPFCNLALWAVGGAVRLH